jgi:hypothetical protein
MLLYEDINQIGPGRQDWGLFNVCFVAHKIELSALGLRMLRDNKAKEGRVLESDSRLHTCIWLLPFGTHPPTLWPYSFG